MELILVGAMVILALLLLVLGPALGFTALWQARQLRARLDHLERRFSGDSGESREAEPAQKVPGKASVGEPSEPEPTVIEAARRSAESFNWEVFLGRKGLGWIAVVLLLFGVAFFLRYAFDNNWIGPQGQIALGILAATGLTAGGWWTWRERRWDVFPQILSAAGLLLFYLSTFASFGYYLVLTREIGGLFLLLTVVAGALFSSLYRAPALAMMTVVGGLLVPYLMQSPHDRYEQFFLYLALLNSGVLLITFWRHWSAVSVVALAGTHTMFWLWYAGNYHPEKFDWALGIQIALFALFLAHSLAHMWFALGKRLHSTWYAWHLMR